MSLRIWLPMNRDLRNQGLDDVAVTNNGATFNSVGKLGGTYLATASGQTITINFANLSTMLANGKTYTLTCWVKPTGTPNSGYVIKLGDNSCGLWWAKSEARWVWNENDNGKRCANPTISADYTNWHHLAIVVDKTVSGKITTQQYVDGVLAAGYPGSTWDCSSHSQPAGTVITISPYVSQLNDIRLYDHCLSPLEVKKLAQGLVLHYPLNRGGWGQENLAKNSLVNISTTSYNTANFNLSEEIVSGASYTATLKGTLGADKSYYGIWMGGGYSALGRFTNNNDGTFTMHFTGPSSVAGNGSRTQINIYAVPSSNTNTCTIEWLKLEKGSIATPWCPNSSDALATTMGLNGTTEYDTSGFCNNGTRTGTFSWTSDTPKYSVSTKFQNGTSITAPSILGATNRYQQLTFAAWIKRTSNDTTDHFYWESTAFTTGISTYNNVSNYFDIRWNHATANSASYHRWIHGTMQKDTWIHVTWVFNSGIWTFYQNGVLSGTRNDSSAGTYLYGEIGQTSASSWVGNVSDIRIYATALSADDVLDLYNNTYTVN